MLQQLVKRLARLARAEIGQRLLERAQHRARDEIALTQRLRVHVLERVRRRATDERLTQTFEHLELLRLASIQRRFAVTVRAGIVGDADEEPVRLGREVDDERRDVRNREASHDACRAGAGSARLMLSTSVSSCGPSMSWIGLPSANATASGVNVPVATIAPPVARS